MNLAVLLVLAGLFVWSYYPTLANLLRTWDSNPDYSHGYLVAPLAIWFLYLRRATAPRLDRIYWSSAGLALIVCAGLLRYTSARFYMTELDSWSMVLWVAGAVWLIGGTAAIRWSWQSLAFLLFMIPLPATVELLVSGPLRQIATNLGTFGLQCLAQPAVREGTTILLDNNILDVERACSGLRMLLGSFALAVAYVIVLKPKRWLALALIVSAFPVALIANAIRLVVTGLLFQYATGETAHRFAHDFAGWLMIPMAAAMFWVVAKLLTHLAGEFAKASEKGWSRLAAYAAVACVFAVTLTGWHFYQQPRNAQTLLARAKTMQTEENWGDAALFFERYLRAQPDDAEVMAELAWTFDKVTYDTSSQTRSLRFFLSALEANPENAALRQRAGALALSIDQPQQSIELLSPLSTNKSLSPSERGDALEGLANAHLMLALRQAPESARQYNSTAADLLQQAIGLDPKRLELAVKLAETYLQKLAEPELPERVKLADTVMDRMVTANTEEADAWLLRYRYATWKEMKGYPAGTTSEADADMERAIALNAARKDRPSINVLLDAAVFAAGKNRRDEAEGYLQTAIERFPDDSRGYTQLAELQVSELEPAGALGAIKTIQQGLRAVSDRDTRLLVPLAAYQIEAKLLADAERTLAALRKLLPNLAGSARRPLEIQIGVLHADWQAASGDLGLATQTLQVLLQTNKAGDLSPGTANDALKPVLAAAWSNLGRLYVRSRSFDRAAEAFSYASQFGVQSMDLSEAGSAAEQAGNLALAAIYYTNSVEQSQSGQARIGLARVYLVQQLLLTKAQRNWTNFEKAMEAAEAAGVDAVALTLLRVEYEAANDNFPAIQTLLKAACERLPDSPALWEAMALVEQRWGTIEAAQHAIAEFQKAVKDELQTAILQAAILTQAGQLDAAYECLQKQLENHQLTEQQQLNLRFRLAQLTLQKDGRLAGRAAAGQLAVQHPGELWLQEYVTRLATEDADWPQVEIMEKRLQKLEGDFGTHWRLFQASRLLAQAKHSEGQQARKAAHVLIDRLQELRPQWYQTSQLRAQLARLEGRYDDAILAFLQSQERGNPSLGVAEELITLLMEVGRFGEAEQHLNRVRDHIASSTLLTSVAIPLHVQKGEVNQALKLAEDWVERNPNDATAYMRLGTTLLITDATALDRAETAFRKAVEMAPQDIRTWTTLFSFYLNRRQDEAAALKLIEGLSTQLEIEPTQRKVVLAQLYEAVGDFLQAGEHFHAACELAANQKDRRLETGVLELAAAFFASRDIAHAEQYARRARQASPDATSATLLLIQILAGQDGNQSLPEAFKLLDALRRQSQVIPGLDRLQAMLLARRGTVEDRQNAITLLEQLQTKQNSKSLASDRIRLASLYEAEGRLLPAHEQLSAMAYEKQVTTEQLGVFIGFLQRHAAKQAEFAAEAERLLAAMDREYESAVVALRIRLVNLTSSPELTKANTSQIQDLAEAFVSEQIAKLDTPEKQQESLTNLLQLLYRQQLTALAEDLALRQEVVSDVIRARSMAGALIVVGRAEAVTPAAEKFLNDALARNPHDASLLFAAGNVCLVQGKLKEATTHYYAVLQLEPGNAGVMNNLALALSEDPTKWNEAAAIITDAIAIAGPVYQLMDTQAVILMKQGEPQRAARLLETAVANSSDPQCELHLAQAYSLTQDFSRAQQLIRRLVGDQSAVQQLSTADQKLLLELQSLLRL